MKKTQKTKTEEVKLPEIVVDASNSILGRLASFAAKQALLGKKVIIVNCDSALLTGRKRMVIGEYGIARRRGSISLNGPHFPKYSDRIMKRTIRGMLSYNQGRGLQALKRVVCYPNTPQEYAASKKINIVAHTKGKTMPLSELSREL